MDFTSSIGEEKEQLAVKSSNCQTYFVSSRQGKRPYNEDRYLCAKYHSNIRKTKTRFLGFQAEYDLYAVFDGHGGSACSTFLKENFHHILSQPKKVLKEPESALKEAF